MRAFKILLKKCFRDIGRNLKQFLSIIFIIAVAITLFIGLEANSEAFERRVDEVYTQGNASDIWITVNPEIFDTKSNLEDFNKVVAANGGDESLVEKRMYLPTTINGISASALISRTLPNINKGYDFELGGDISQNNFFVIDKELVSRYKVLTGKDIGIGDTLPVSYDLTSIKSALGDPTEFANNIIDKLLESILQSESISTAVKAIITSYIEGNRDQVVKAIEDAYNSIFSIDTLTIDVKINGLMRHPENIQNATFTNSNFLLSSKVVIKKFASQLAENISFSDPTIVAMIKSLLSDADKVIDEESNEFVNDLLNNFYNQYILILGKNKSLNNVERELTSYFTTKGNLLAIFNKNNMPSNAVISNDIVQSRQLTYCFPLIFFLVAILVVLTTISQLILKERTQIGTFKSLGISKNTILFYYIAMMSVIALIGTILGLIIGPLLLPGILNLKYSILYSLPALHYIFPWIYALVCVILVVFAVAALTFLLIRKEINLTPANSMRPAAPNVKFKEKKKNSKHISMMMALRNIRVHIAKSIMVVIGVLGCTGLLICGMGIEDTIDYGINYDLNNILASDIQLTYNSGVRAGSVTNEILDLTDENGEKFVKVCEEYSIMQTTVSSSKTSVNTYLYYFDKTATNFKYEKWNDENGEGIAINKGKAEELGIKLGDYITFSVNNVTYSKKIVSIFYTMSVSGLFVYTSTMPELTNYRSNARITLRDNMDLKVAKDLLENSTVNEINSAMTRDENMARIDSYMGNVNTMTNTIKIFAIVLAVIVLINLSILNYRERMRDYATLKVLGYSRFEISRSMIYEGMILTTIGGILGVVAGYPLEILVLGTNKTPLLSWSYTIYPTTMFIALLASLITALAINIFTSLSIKKISMSESLKSVE